MQRHAMENLEIYGKELIRCLKCERNEKSKWAFRRCSSPGCCAFESLASSQRLSKPVCEDHEFVKDVRAVYKAYDLMCKGTVSVSFL